MLISSVLDTRFRSEHQNPTPDMNYSALIPADSASSGFIRFWQWQYNQLLKDLPQRHSTECWRAFSGHAQPALGTNPTVAFSCNCCKKSHLDNILGGRFNHLSARGRTHSPPQRGRNGTSVRREFVRMKSVIRKCLLALVVVVCLVPASFAGRPKDKGCDDDHGRKDKHCRQVPEGGSAAIYLLGAGITCLGAMFIRSRSSNPSQS